MKALSRRKSQQVGRRCGQTAILLFVAGALFCIGCKEQPVEVLIDLSRIAGQSRDSIEAVHGKPMVCAEAITGPECKYSDGHLRIIYLGDTAIMIFFRPQDSIPLDDRAIERIGFQGEPFIRNPGGYEYRALKGKNSVTIIADDDNHVYRYEVRNYNVEL
ncbi:MAG: hypothetical protein RH862_05560 [Leptospiraceae bacterium]